ncbi:MAG: hypothetical protein Q8O40_07600 [Chloroflexota bacterium]|nr:hypothetical protein [Chloroflexota bacterium]
MNEVVAACSEASAYTQANLIDDRTKELGEWILKEPAVRFTQLLHALGVIEEHDPRQIRLPGPEFQPGGDDEEGQTQS